MANSVKLLGVNELLKKIDRAGDTYNRKAKLLVEDVADKIETQAQDYAPDRRANQEVAISQNIAKYPENNGFTYRIEVGDQALPFAAYCEFGTGQDAKTYLPGLPPEWQKLAYSFYVNGKGTLRHTPFLYPAYFKYSPELIAGLRLIIKSTKL